jgi:putative membrane protein
MANFMILGSNFLVHWSGYNWGMGPGMMAGGYGMGWDGPVFMLIFLAAAVALIVLIVKWVASLTKHEKQGAAQGDSALEILRQRFATGEIDREEFEEKKKALGS